MFDFNIVVYYFKLKKTKINAKYVETIMFYSYYKEGKYSKQET